MSNFVQMTCIITIICMRAACSYASLSVGTPAAPRSIITTGCAVAWCPSAPGLSYRISVCRLQGTTNCPIETSCIGCSSTSITGITESGNYSISVCSSSVVNGVPCMSEVCAPPVIVGKIKLQRSEWQPRYTENINAHVDSAMANSKDC